MSTIPYRSPPLPGKTVEGRRLLLVFGVLLIILGALCACAAAVLALTLTMALPAPSVQFEARGYFLQFFLLLSVLTLLFISTGVASIRLRRWARPIIISFAGLFIFSALVMLLQFLVPTIASQLMATPPAQLPPANQPPVVAQPFAE